MTDTIMWKHMQGYRQRWHEAKAAVEKNDELDVDHEYARAHFHMVTSNWVERLLPLDTVEDHRPEIWHERDIAGYEGLRGALDALDDRRPADDPLPAEDLAEIGHAAEEMTVDAVGLSDIPPVDVEPWTPPPAEETRKLIEELRERAPPLPDELAGDSL